VAKMDFLSDREKKILKLLVDGYSTAAVASRLKVGAPSIQADIIEIIRKLTAKFDDDTPMTGVQAADRLG
jgi:DNA-binding CsgD family transcriptional regulator